MGWDSRLKPMREDFRPVRVNGEVLVKTDVDARIQAGLPTDLKYQSRANRRACVNLIHVAACERHIGRLPAPDETFHCVVGSTYPLWAMVPAVANLAGEVKIESLHVSTLSFSKYNGDELVGMLDAGQIGRVVLLASCHFKAVNAEIYDPIHKALTDRGHRIAARRTHAKVLAFALSDGRRFTVEGSANLRSGKSVEQFCMTGDAGLYEFHVGWMESLIHEGA